MILSGQSIKIAMEILSLIYSTNKWPEKLKRLQIITASTINCSSSLHYLGYINVMGLAISRETSTLI